MSAIGRFAIDMRDYQLESHRLVETEFERWKTVLLVLPTGAGKTTVLTYYIWRRLLLGKRTIVIAHRQELVKQISARLRRAKIEHGIVMSGQDENPSAPVQVCSIQTLIQMSSVPPADDIVVDEAHHINAESYLKIIAIYGPDTRILGVTATAERGDGGKMGDVFQSMVVPTTMQALIDAGYLIPAQVIAPAQRQAELWQNPIGSYLMTAPGKRAIVFTPTVSAAKTWEAIYRGAGVPARTIHSNYKHRDKKGNIVIVPGTTPEDRDTWLGQLDSGIVKVILNVAIVTEGFDCPSAEAIGLGKGFGHTGIYDQVVGRGSRPKDKIAKPGEHYLVMDWMGNVWDHGLPGAPRVYSLLDKIKNGRQESLQRCGACGCVEKPSAACGRCGLSREIMKARIAKKSLPTQAEIIAKHARKLHWFNIYTSSENFKLYGRPYANDLFVKQYDHDIPEAWWSMKGVAA